MRKTLLALAIAGLPFAASAMDVSAFKPLTSKSCTTYAGQMSVRLQGDLSAPVMVVTFTDEANIKNKGPHAFKTKAIKWGSSACWEAKLRKTDKFWNSSTVAVCHKPGEYLWAGGKPSSQLRNYGWKKETFNEC